MLRALYGHRAGRSTRLIDQLERTFADAEETAGEDEALGEVAARHTAVEAHLRARPARRAFPEHLPRERVVVAPPPACPCCGSDDLSKLGEDGPETLEVIPRRCKVVPPVRERFACRACEEGSQQPDPFHRTPPGSVGPILLSL